MAVGDLIRLTINQTIDSAISQNVMYYVVQADDDVTEAAVVIPGAFIGTVIPIWRIIVTADVRFDCISSQKVFPGPIGASQEFDISLDGLKAEESLLAMDAGLIQKFNPAVGGVGKKGRVYVTGISELDSEKGRWLPTPFDDFKDLSDVMQQNLTSVLNGDYGPAWAVRDPNPPNPVTGFVTDLTFAALPRIATQRRRRTPIRSTIAP